MLDEVNGYTVDLFSNSVISAIINFFSMLAWGLGLIGAFIAMMEFAVTFIVQRGRQLSRHRYEYAAAVYCAPHLFPPSRFCSFSFRWIFTARFAAAAVGSMSGSSASISDLAKGAIDSMFQSVYGSTPLHTAYRRHMVVSETAPPDGFQMTDGSTQPSNTNRQLVGAHSACRNRVGDLQNLFRQPEARRDSAYTDLRRLPAHAFFGARLYGRFQHMVQAGGRYLLYSFHAESSLSSCTDYAARC